MSWYLILEYVVILFSIVYISLRVRIAAPKSDNTNTRGYSFVIVVLLTLFLGLRGADTVDYHNYVNVFYVAKQYDLFEYLNNATQEHGFYLLTWLCAHSNLDHVFYFSIMAFFTSYFFVKYIRKYSPSVWFSVLFLLSFGCFFTADNITRNIMAVALYSFAIKYAIEKRLVAYVISILLVSLFHLSALFMLPFYFLLNIKWNKKNAQVGVILWCAFWGVIYVFSPQVTNLLMKFVYQGYNYGIDFGLSYVSVFKVLIVELFILLNYRKLDFENSTDVVLFNCSLVYSGLYLCALQVFMLQRLSYYFSLAHVVLVPLIITRTKKRDYRVLMLCGWIIFMLLYSWLSFGSAIRTWYWE